MAEDEDRRRDRMGRDGTVSHAIERANEASTMQGK